MPILRVYVSDQDLADLERFSADLGCPLEDLAEAAISEAVCRAKNPAPDPRQGRLDL